MSANGPPRATLGWTPTGSARRRCTFTDRCDVGRAPSNRIIVSSESASRLHVQLVIDRDGLKLTNVSASNPVEVVGRAAVPPGGVVQLSAGDTFVVGGQAVAVEDLHAPVAMLTCANPSCRRQVAASNRDCPWCGFSLAFALTHGGSQ